MGDGCAGRAGTRRQIRPSGCRHAGSCTGCCCRRRRSHSSHAWRCARCGWPASGGTWNRRAARWRDGRAPGRRPASRGARRRRRCRTDSRGAGSRRRGRTAGDGRSGRANGQPGLLIGYRPASIADWRSLIDATAGIGCGSRCGGRRCRGATVITHEPGLVAVPASACAGPCTGACSGPCGGAGAIAEDANRIAAHARDVGRNEVAASIEERPRRRRRQEQRRQDIEHRRLHVVAFRINFI